MTDPKEVADLVLKVHRFRPVGADYWSIWRLGPAYPGIGFEWEEVDLVPATTLETLSSELERVKGERDALGRAVNKFAFERDSAEASLGIAVKALASAADAPRSHPGRSEPIMTDPNSREASMIVVSRKIDGTPDVWCDPEIADLVAALNAAGLRTVASCSGHGHCPGRISMQDGREIILPRPGDLERIEAMFAVDVNGDGSERYLDWNEKP